MHTPVTGQQDNPVVSVVAPLFNEEMNVGPLVAALTEVLDGTGDSYEIILVDDGSSDTTWQAIEGASKANPRVRGIRLSRNFGHQNAIFAGLHAARGRAVVTMDGDLQHPPALLPRMLDAWRQGYHIVETRRTESEDTTLFKRATSRWFYRIFSALSGIPMSAGTSDFRLMDANVAAVIRQMKDADLFLRGIAHWVGFNRTAD